MRKQLGHFACYGIGIGLSLFLTSAALAAGQVVTIFKLTDSQEKNGMAEEIGHITLEETPRGLSITPAIHGLKPGEHGFHIHENASCAPMLKDGKMTAGMGAGNHFDPDNAHSHHGPYSKLGHLGDLPILLVDEKGNATTSVVAPRLKLSQIQSRSIIIHEGGDNYLDYPKPLGGGGPRVACGMIK